MSSTSTVFPGSIIQPQTDKNGEQPSIYDFITNAAQRAAIFSRQIAFEPFDCSGYINTMCSQAQSVQKTFARLPSGLYMISSPIIILPSFWLCGDGVGGFATVVTTGLGYGYAAGTQVQGISGSNLECAFKGYNWPDGDFLHYTHLSGIRAWPEVGFRAYCTGDAVGNVTIVPNPSGPNYDATLLTQFTEAMVGCELTIQNPIGAYPVNFVRMITGFTDATHITLEAGIPGGAWTSPLIIAISTLQKTTGSGMSITGVGFKIYQPGENCYFEDCDAQNWPTAGYMVSGGLAELNMSRIHHGNCGNGPTYGYGLWFYNAGGSANCHLVTGDNNNVHTCISNDSSFIGAGYALNVHLLDIKAEGNTQGVSYGKHQPLILCQNLGAGSLAIDGGACTNSSYTNPLDPFGPDPTPSGPFGASAIVKITGTTGFVKLGQIYTSGYYYYVWDEASGLPSVLAPQGQYPTYPRPGIFTHNLPAIISGPLSVGFVPTAEAHIHARVPAPQAAPLGAGLFTADYGTATSDGSNTLTAVEASFFANMVGRQFQFNGTVYTVETVAANYATLTATTTIPASSAATVFTALLVGIAPQQVETADGTITLESMDVQGRKVIGNLPLPWQPNVLTSAGATVLDTYSNVQFCITPGTTGATAPAWSDSANTTDNTVVWSPIALQMNELSRLNVVSDYFRQALTLVGMGPNAAALNLIPVDFGGLPWFIGAMSSNSDSVAPAGCLVFRMNSSSPVNGLVITPAGALLPGGTTSGMYAGSGSPNGAVTANVGSVFLRVDGGAGTSLYVKESGTGNTGWTAVSSGSSSSAVLGASALVDSGAVPMVSSTPGTLMESGLSDNGTTLTAARSLALTGITSALPISTQANSYSEIRQYTAGAGGGDSQSGQFSVWGSRGTVASPTASQVNDVVLRLDARPYDGSNYQLAGVIRVLVAATVSAGITPTKVTVTTTNTSGGQQTALTLDDAGNAVVYGDLTIGNGATDVAATLASLQAQITALAAKYEAHEHTAGTLTAAAVAVTGKTGTTDTP